MKALVTYFFEDRKSRTVKIGKSVSPYARLKQLQTGCPHPLSIAMLLPVGIEFMGDCQPGDWDEQTLHLRFAKYRINGEWFLMSPEIVSFLKEMRRLGA